MIPESVLNRLIYDGGFITAEVQATLPDCRRWIAIYPCPEPSLVDRIIPKHSYSVVDFELKERLIDEYFGEDDKLNQARYYLNNMNEVDTLLDNLGLSKVEFTYPWRCGYPL